MSNEFLGSHLSALYKLLGHAGAWSRVGSLDYSTKKFEQKYVFGESEVLKYAREFNGKRNIFISRAARNKDGSVAYCRVISFDIDPIRRKDTAATDEQHQQALRAGQEILRTYPGGYCASSGNGCLLLYFVDKFVDTTPNYYAREAVLIKELNELVGAKYNVKVDSTNYSEAVIKAIGTQSTKGSVDLRRISRFMEAVHTPFRNWSTIIQRIEGIKTIKPSNGKAELPIFLGDRSVADFHLVSYLHKQGVKPEVAVAALQANPLGRKTDEKDQARLINKIYGAGNSSISDNERESTYFDRLFNKDQINGLQTGFKNLDQALGTLPQGELFTVAARSNYGKSTFACTMAEYHRQQGKRVLYFSTEMHKDYIMHKLCALACNIPLSTFIKKTFTAEERSNILRYHSKYEILPINICDDFQPTIEKVKAEVIQYSPDLVIFDHINQTETHWEKIAQFVRALKVLTRDQKCVTLMLSQLNEPPRNPKTGEEMQSIRGDVRGTQEIIHLSGIFIFLCNPFDIKGDQQPVELHIAKNRYGISGQVVTLNVDKRVSKFYE